MYKQKIKNNMKKQAKIPTPPQIYNLYDIDKNYVLNHIQNNDPNYLLEKFDNQYSMIESYVGKNYKTLTRNLNILDNNLYIFSCSTSPSTYLNDIKMCNCPKYSTVYCLNDKQRKTHKKCNQNTYCFIKKKNTNFHPINTGKNAAIMATLIQKLLKDGFVQVKHERRTYRKDNHVLIVRTGYVNSKKIEICKMKGYRFCLLDGSCINKYDNNINNCIFFDDIFKNKYNF